MGDNAETLRRLWDAWSRGSVPEILALLHPEVEWSSVALGRRYRGHEDVSAWLAAMRGQFKSLTVIFERVQEVGPDVALAYGRARGFGHGGDDTLNAPLTWVAEFRDGLVHRGRVFADAEEAHAYLAARGPGPGPRPRPGG